MDFPDFIETTKPVIRENRITIEDNFDMSFSEDKIYVGTAADNYIVLNSEARCSKTVGAAFTGKVKTENGETYPLWENDAVHVSSAKTTMERCTGSCVGCTTCYGCYNKTYSGCQGCTTNCAGCNTGCTSGCTTACTSNVGTSTCKGCNTQCNNCTTCTAVNTTTGFCINATGCTSCTSGCTLGCTTGFQTNDYIDCTSSCQNGQNGLTDEDYFILSKCKQSVTGHTCAMVTAFYECVTFVTCSNNNIG